MNHSKKTALAALIAVIALAGACAKKAKDTTEAEKNGEVGANMIVASLQLPIPGNTYAYSTDNPPPSNAPIAGTNVARLQALVDGIAEPLKESNHGLKQTLSKGQYLKAALHVTLEKLKSELKGSRQDNQGTINWTYKTNDTAIFSGTTSLPGTLGDLLFSESRFNSKEIKVHWAFSNAGGQSTKSLTVNQAGAGSVGFTQIFEPNNTSAAVSFTANNGAASFTGKWDNSGGYLQEGSNAKQCWGAQLQDIACPAATSTSQSKVQRSRI